MKTFVFSTIALAILCAIVIWNCFYIKDVCNELSEQADNINSISDAEEVDKLEELWEKNKFLICISVPHKETDELERNLILLKTKIKTQNEMEFKETLSLVLWSIDEIKIHGIAKADNVF